MEAQLDRPSIRRLAAAYGVSHEALALWARMGAPVGDVEGLFAFLRRRERRGKLHLQLCHPEKRRRIAAEIRNLSGL